MHRHVANLCFAVLLSDVALGVTGCVGLPSATLPPRLTAAEEARLEGAHLHFAVGVETNAWSQLVISRLRETKLFDAVDYVDRLPRPPSVLARFEHTPYGTAMIPAASLMTLGIIPSSVSEPLSFGCSFYSPHHPEQTVIVEYRYQSRTTLGWVSPFRALSSDVVMTKPDSHRRFYQRLSLAILDRSDEIKRLVE